MRILCSRFIDLQVAENSVHEIQTAYSEETLSLEEKTAVAITTDVAGDNAGITITKVSLGERQFLQDWSIPLHCNVLHTLASIFCVP
jgi:hypothetical protein